MHVTKLAASLTLYKILEDAEVSIVWSRPRLFLSRLSTYRTEFFLHTRTWLKNPQHLTKKLFLPGHAAFSGVAIGYIYRLYIFSLESIATNLGQPLTELRMIFKLEITLPWHTESLQYCMSDNVPLVTTSLIVAPLVTTSLVVAPLVAEMRGCYAFLLAVSPADQKPSTKQTNKAVKQ